MSAHRECMQLDRKEIFSMTAQYVEGQPFVEGPRNRRDLRTAEMSETGSIAEALTGAAGAILAILGLAGALPHYMMAVATIVLGAALLFQGGSVAARYDRLIRAIPGRNASLAVGGGLTAESLAGIAGIVLGILALLGAWSPPLSAVALLLFGVAELLGSAATSRFNSIAVDYSDEPLTTRHLLREAINLSVGGQALIGLAAVVLGIIALIGVLPEVLVFAGLLGIGCCVLLSGSAVGARVLGILRHSHV